MFAGIITAFASIVGQRFAKAAAIASAIVLAIALLSIGKCVYDRHVENAYVEKVQKKAAPATAKASEERTIDESTNAKDEKELHNAINASPGGTLSPAAHALACERLHRAGRDPAACRSGGGN